MERAPEGAHQISLAGNDSKIQYQRRQTFPAPHTAHRRTWRLVVLATQTPPTRVLPAPHA